MDTFITNVTAVTMAPGTEVLFGVNIAVTDGKIEFISKNVPQELPQPIIDGTGMVARPSCGATPMTSPTGRPWRSC